MYVMSGLGCAASSMYYKLYVHDRRYGSPPPLLGASGCISVILASFAVMFPRARVTMIVVPMPAWVAVGGFALYDIWKATREVQGRVCWSFRWWCWWFVVVLFHAIINAMYYILCNIEQYTMRKSIPLVIEKEFDYMLCD